MIYLLMALLAGQVGTWSSALSGNPNAVNIRYYYQITDDGRALYTGKDELKPGEVVNARVAILRAVIGGKAFEADAITEQSIPQWWEMRRLNDQEWATLNELQKQVVGRIVLRCNPIPKDEKELRKYDVMIPAIIKHMRSVP